MYFTYKKNKQKKHSFRDAVAAFVLKVREKEKKMGHAKQNYDFWNETFSNIKSVE